MSKCTHAATLHETMSESRPQLADSYRASHNLVVIECQGHFSSIARDIIINMFADGPTVSNALVKRRRARLVPGWGTARELLTVLSALHLSLVLLQRHSRRTEKIESYTETSRGSNERERQRDRAREREREREREPIEVDAGTSKPTHGSEGPAEGGSRRGSNPPPQPQP